jgi:cobalamin-dependent methionine synthase I
MIIIGERLNSARPAIRAAMAKRDKSFLVEQARLQVLAGADYLDVNAAALLEREKDILRWAVPLLQDAAGVPLCVDTPDPEAMEVALRAHQGRALLNSLPGSRERVERLLPLIKRYRPRVIVLCLDDGGAATTPDHALAIARRMAGLIIRQGLEAEDVFIDPLAHSAAAERKAAVRLLASLRKVKDRLPGVRTVAGLSNISFGLPQRRLLNRTLLVLALEAGLDAAICDPLDKDLRLALAAAEALLGRDSGWTKFRRAVLNGGGRKDRPEAKDRRG